MTLVFLALLTGASCADAPAALQAALRQEADPGALWQLAPLAGAEGVEILTARSRDVQGQEALVVPVALGLSRRAEALGALRRVPPNTREATLGRALGLLALGDNSVTATVADGLSNPLLAEHRSLTARALARMPAKIPRELSYDLLSDVDPEVRVAVAELHLRRGSRKARTVLEAAARGAEPRAEEATAMLLRDGHRFSASDLSRLPSVLRGPAMVTWVEPRGVTRDQLVQGDPGLRAGAIAASLRNGEPPVPLILALLQRRSTRHEESVGEAAIVQALTGEMGSKELEALSPSGIRGVVEVLTAFSVDPVPFVSRTRIQNIVRFAEGWQADGRLTPPDQARLLRALGRLDGTASLGWARAGLDASPEIALAALNTVEEAGRAKDADALLSVAQGATGWVRARALEAAMAVCRR